METVSNETTLSKDTDPDDNDLVVKVAALSARLAAHEDEKQLMRAEFGQQRAKMKELFLQKEEELKRGSSEHNKLLEEIEKLKAELNDAQTQVTVTRLDLEARLDEQKQRNQAEITSLQQLVSDTLEESSRYDEEVKRLRRANEQLVAELRAGAGASLSGARGGDAAATSEGGPQQLLTVPGAMITTLARKVVSQLGSASAPDSLSSSTVAASGLSSATLSASSPVTSQQPPSGADSLEESMRKAQEDADVLRSLVIPLEEEINALKDKLRTADQQLRQYQGSDELIHLESSENSTSQNQTELLSPNKPNESRMRKESSDSSLNRKVVQDKKCDMCANYENQLVAAQQRSSQLEKQLISMERCKEELAKETVIRKDMEQKWNEKKEFHKAEVTELQQRAKEAEECVKELKQLFEQVKTAAIDDLNRLSGERQTVQIQLDRLQMENEDLIGKRNANARKLEEEVIDLPNSVEELQELTLKFREDLIAARVGQEAAEQKVGELREQLHCETQNRQASEASFSHQVESLKAQLYKCESQLQAAQRRRDTSSSDDDRSLRQELDDVKVELLTTRNDKLRLAATVGELKSRVLSLQTELKNSEIVQQDFVRLSQSLQTELERIRNSHTELRWEHEDDIEQCPGCHFNFAQNFSTNSRKKVHCLHCGRVFCVVCLTHTVLSGPKQRPSKVCDVCHTLLEQYTAPYFSTEPPHSPAN